DRAHWGLGSRRAEPSYDLFALVMTILHIFYPKRFGKGNKPEQTLLRKVLAVKPLNIYYRPLKKAIEGKYTTSSDMKTDITNILYQVQKGKKSGGLINSMQPVWMESAGIALLASVYYMVSFI